MEVQEWGGAVQAVPAWALLHCREDAAGRHRPTVSCNGQSTTEFTAFRDLAERDKDQGRKTNLARLDRICAAGKVRQGHDRAKLDCPCPSTYQQINFKLTFTFQEVPAVESVSLLQFRRDAEGIIRKVRQGKRLVLTYRGQPVMRLEPIPKGRAAADDPFYHLAELAVPDARPLTNEEIDWIVYEG